MSEPQSPHLYNLWTTQLASVVRALGWSVESLEIREEEIVVRLTKPTRMSAEPERPRQQQ